MSDPVAVQTSPEGVPGTGSNRVSTRRQRARLALLGAIGVLYVVSVPWYRDDDAPLRVWFGLPDWVAVALGCYIGVAVLNAIAWWLTDIPEAEAQPGASDGGAP